MTLPGGLTRAARLTSVSQPHRQKRRHSRSARSPGSIASGASSTLSWSSTKATTCSGTGFSPPGVSGSVSVSPTASTTYGITCTGLGGSTTRSAAVIVNPAPGFSWSQSLPVTFHDPAIVPFGGTETRGLLFMDGSLYAGIGDWEDPRLENSQTPAAQVLRLEFSNEQLGRRPGFQSGRAQQRRKVLSGDRHARDGAFRSQLAQQTDYPGRRPHGRFLECGH